MLNESPQEPHFLFERLPLTTRKAIVHHASEVFCHYGDDVFPVSLQGEYPDIYARAVTRYQVRIRLFEEATMIAVEPVLQRHYLSGEPISIQKFIEEIHEASRAYLRSKLLTRSA